MPNETSVDCVERIEALLDKVEGLPDDAVREDVREIVHCLLEYHAAALARLVSLLPRSAGESPSLLTRLSQDELVGSLLLLHGLHPADLESRVLDGLRRARPFLESHGGDVELIEIRDGAVRLRLKGSCRGCPNSAATLRSHIEQAIRDAAPEVDVVEVEEARLTAPTLGFVPLTILETAVR